MERINKRKHKRFSATAFLNTPVVLAPLAPFFGHPAKGRVIDLSAGGMSLVMDELIPQGNRLALTIRFPDHSEVNTTVQVIHVTQRDKTYLHGFEFLSLPAFMADKIEQMSADYIDCENRIQSKEEDVCRLNCAFYNMCSKAERRQPLFDVDIALELALRALEDTPLRF